MPGTVRRVVTLLLLVLGAVALLPSAAVAAPADAAGLVERRATVVVELVRRPGDARLRGALAALRRALRAARDVPGARSGAAGADLRRVRRGLRHAVRARRLAHARKQHRARRAAARARRRLKPPLLALRALCCAPAPAVVVGPSAPPALPDPAPAPRPRVPDRTSGYAPVDLPVGQRPYDRPKAVPLDAPNNPVDEDGVVVYERDGQRHSHPTVLETYVLAMINGHRLHPDEPEYLRRARANADELLEHAVRPPGEVWLSYTFGFDVFGNPAEHLAAPWHSGMAQGRALLVFHSLAEIEPSAQLRARWLAAADAVYATTFRERRPGERWFRFSDDDGYVWFEEYPSVAEPPRVLNGHNSATIGYWKRALATGDPEARRLFDAGATTARHYAEVLRRPGDYSAYSVRTPVQSAYYHEMHTTQLRELAAMTGDPGFEELARQYEADLEAATARRSQ